MLGTSVLDNMQRDVYVATAADNYQIAGQIITWVTHASLVVEKRNVICVFSKFNHTYKTIKKTGRFVLNLPTENQLESVSIFGLESGNEKDKFSVFKNFRLYNELPILNDTCGYSILRLLSEVDLGDRIVVIARVEEEVFEKEKKPLKLRDFLKGLSTEELSIQKSKYLDMVNRDIKYIKDEI